MRVPSFVFGILCFVPGVAAAREVVYAQAEGCPSREDVASRMDGPGRAARLDVTRTEGGYHGVLTIGEGDTGLVREVDARTCDAVIDALSLVASLDREPEPKRESAPVVVAAPPPEVDRVPAPPKQPTRSIDVTLGALVDATQIWQGGSLEGAQIFGDVATSGPWSLRPSARLALGRTLESKSVDGAYGTSVRLTRGAIDLCPIGWGVPNAPVLLSACSRTELGALEIATDGAAASGTTRFWAATGGEARARVAIGSRFVLDAGGGALVQLRRDDFLIADLPGKRLPPLSWTASLGAGVVLP